MTYYSSTCDICDQLIEWCVDPATGNQYWAHRDLTIIHEAQQDWRPLT